ncbi:GNAT family N-acetyltransferase [Salegentibacter chungangensis]|uniref:GNAT family N-acetyltransferase n=1 Tax=Salegentibacter chungangensis TaxID=1335724 RepID=A0ABW3NQS2_9FLAO
MEVKHKENNSRGMFYIEGEKGIIAELTYSKKENDVITIDYVEVDEKLEGEGLGTKLVKESVDYARGNKLKIDPLCPFAEVQFDRNASYEDVKVS